MIRDKYAVATDERTGRNIVFFDCGMGDGAYTTWFGRTRSVRWHASWQTSIMLEHALPADDCYTSAFAAASAGYGVAPRNSYRLPTGRFPGHLREVCARAVARAAPPSEPEKDRSLRSWQ